MSDTRYQVVWWGFQWMFSDGWRGMFRFRRLDPAETDLAGIYTWVLAFGPLEVRRWRKR